MKGPFTSPMSGAGTGAPIKVQAVPAVNTGSLDYLHFIGFVFIAFSLPPAAVIVGSCTLWYYIDPVTLRLCRYLTSLAAPKFEFMVRNPKDAFLVPLVFLQGVVIPAFFAFCFWHQLQNGFTPLLAFAYHCVRLGPYFTGYAYAYTMCHKEGHQSRLGLFKPPYSHGLKNVWNWWIGVFYGVMPSNFAYGHSLNHHTYNNDEDDIITTWDRPRDSFLNYVHYLHRFILYALNFNTMYQFVLEKKYGIARTILIGSIYYFGIFGFFAYHDLSFAVVYLGYPMVESMLLLSAINWAWHCFLDPDTQNVYAYSVTIFEGEENTNILNEDYHVVHHQYPGAHWSKHPSLFEKHKEEYATNKATIFKQTHAIEIFFLAILKQYDVFADKFVDLSGEMSREEIVALIKTRLRTCSWGEFANKAK
jgi:hypothetical protein